MKSNHFLQVIILCFSILWANMALASSGQQAEVKAWVNSKGRLLIDTFSENDLEQKYQKLDELFLNYVDLDYIAKFVVGKYWRTMTEPQKEAYVPLFKRYSLGVYKSFPLNFENKIGFEVTSVLASDNFIDVTTTIDLGSNKPEQQLFVVIFRLVKNGDEYKIIDIKLAESSLILSYRNSFYEMINRNDGDIDWFLEDLENIAISTEKSNSLKLKNIQ